MTIKTLGAALVSGTFFLSLAAAQPAPTPPATPAPTPAAPGTPATPPAAPAESTDAKLDKAFGEHESFKTFFADLQKAVADEDAKAVAALVNVPFKTKVNGQEMTFETTKDVEKAYHDLFTPSIVSAIAAATYETLTVNQAGVAIGSGQVWFNKVGTGAEAKVKVIALNPAAGL